MKEYYVHISKLLVVVFMTISNSRAIEPVHIHRSSCLVASIFGWDKYVSRKILAVTHYSVSESVCVVLTRLFHLHDSDITQMTTKSEG